MRLIKPAILLTALIAVTSCRAPRDITYLQNLQSTDQPAALPPSRAVTAQPDDRLSIIVHSKDPLLVEQFNLPVSNHRIGTARSGRGSNNNLNSNGYGYQSAFVVDDFGDIEYPVLGTLHVAGLTRQQIENLIKNDLIERNLVKDPTVKVEFLDHFITALGQVNTKGRIYFDRDHLTLIEGIGLAGDLAMDGQRQNVRVFREVNGKEEVYTVDLTDAASVYNSPAYYLQQNDVIYVEPSDIAKRRTTATGASPLTPTFWISLVSSLVSLTLIFVRL